MKAPTKKATTPAAADSRPAPKTVGGKTLSQTIEVAMSQSVTDAYAKGITDPDKQRELMRIAREKAKAEFGA